MKMLSIVIFSMFYQRDICVHRLILHIHFRKRILSLHLIAFANALANSLMYFSKKISLCYFLNRIHVKNSIVHAGAFGYGIKLVRNNEISFDGVFRVYSVITFGAISIGRSAAMAPNYSKGKASVERILELNERSSKIDPDDKSGVILVKFKNIIIDFSI